MGVLEGSRELLLFTMEFAVSYHPRIETSHVATFQTTRTLHSRLWFVNNPDLEEAILGYAAKYAARYAVKLYAMAIEGNHIQFPALFPKANRAQFMRDFNSSVARIVPRYQRNHPGARFWARRYSAEYLPGPDDIEEQFFYTVLQPVQDGLVDSIHEYPGYNCFDDAIHSRPRRFKVVRWKEYHDALRWDAKISVSDFTEYVELKYERLPGYENFSTAEYVRCMRRKLKERTEEILAKRQGATSAGAKRLEQVAAGSLPNKTKTSTIKSHRPRILSKDDRRRAEGKAWYFSIYYDYRDKSEQYRNGFLEVCFPPGTYKPPIFTVANSIRFDNQLIVM